MTTEQTQPTRDVNALVGHCATVKYEKAGYVISPGRVFFHDGDWHKVANLPDPNRDPIEIETVDGDQIKLGRRDAIAYAY